MERFRCLILLIALILSMIEINPNKNNEVIVLGGSKDLYHDFLAIKHIKEPIIIAVNHHWVKTGIMPDYMVFFDDRKRIDILGQAIKSFNGITISQCEPAGIIIDPDTRKHIGPGDTGLVAAWFGMQITTGMVYLCGFDCYQWIHKPRVVDQKMACWKNFFLKFGCERVVPVSGPLKTMVEELNGQARQSTI
jgi:hypothetical protein